jgi:hypothetical protein
MTLHSAKSSKPCISNDNGAARSSVLRGASVAQRKKLTKSQLAVLGADVLDGVQPYQPTRVDTAKLFRVSVVTLDRARRLSPAARATIMKGAATLSSYEPSLSPSKANGNGRHRGQNGNSHGFAQPIDDQTIRNMIAAAGGIDRLFDRACALDE